ncbi:MAG: 2Fe-2S iron-sulfur cluster binding domain-containing protein [Sphingopyxis sp.]|nr:2Fe-2S iron-sulfur cluster binding domain-containing protein [Sphingopyxis sp.]
MPILTIVDREGTAHALEAAAGLNLMEIIREHGFDELLALCGGCCSCATCHVHVAAEFAAKVAPVCQDENDLLDSSSDRNATSRLACQIPFGDDLDGIRVTIARDD